MKCYKGHRFPSEYDSNCKYCVSVYGRRLNESKEVRDKIIKYFKKGDK